MSLLKVIAKAE